MLNEKIKSLRKQKGYTQEILAQELNVVRQTVSKWEKGYSVPDAVMLEKIADLFEISVSELLDGAEENAEDKPTLAQISDQLSILNNQFAKELARKRKNRKIVIGIFSVIFAVVFLIGIFILFPSKEEIYIDSNEDTVTGVADIDSKLSKAISDVIISKNSSSYLPGECKTESHFIFSTEEKGETVTVYLIEDYAEFGFYNGFFTNISGGSTPAVFKFKKNGEDYKFIKAEYAQDGSLYISSIEEMFPNKIAKKVKNGLSENENNFMWIAKVKQAQVYLKSINRQATICKYSDIATEFLTDYGIETEIVNKITEMGLEYDNDIANHEKIENGKRYVYQTDYDRQNDWVTFTKFEYDTKNIIEFIAVDGDSGEIVKNAKKPEKVKYKMGKTETSSQYTTAAYYN